MKEKKDSFDQNLNDQLAATVIMINNVMSSSMDKIIQDYSPVMTIVFAMNALAMPMASLFANIKGYDPKQMSEEVIYILEKHFQKYREVIEEEKKDE
jgi:hypothetical protein